MVGVSGTRPPGGRKASTSVGDVRVCVRIRPCNDMEQRLGPEEAVRCASPEHISVDEEDFTFDRIFAETSTQEEVFAFVAKPIVQDVMAGFNGTIFAYGQTGSGKTHTMEGQPSDAEGAGVIPRAVAELFRTVEAADEGVLFTIKVSYVEVYMEKIRDLLDGNGVRTNLQVREDKLRGVYISGATERYVTSEEELLSTLTDGARNRAVAATGMNSGSSRSHSVFIVSVQQTESASNSSKTGTLFLVDLAGSEMVKKTHASGQVLEEAKTINKSLSALGQVINALTDGKSQHVPYRDSRLTRILQNSLGGNSKTCLIVCCSPAAYNAPETLSSLRFGSRAKKIKNKAVVNEERSSAELAALLAKAEDTIKLRDAQILALEAQLLDTRQRSHSTLIAETSTSRSARTSSSAHYSPPTSPKNADREPETAVKDASAGSSGSAAAAAAVPLAAAAADAAGLEGSVAVDGEIAVSDAACPEETAVVEEAATAAAAAAEGNAAAAFSQLSDRIQALESDLEEERGELARRAHEVNTLTAMLAQRDESVAELERLLVEVRAEAAAAVASAEEAAAAAAAALELARQEEERARYEASKAHLDKERLEKERIRLDEELQELRLLTRDTASATPQTPPPPTATSPTQTTRENAEIAELLGGTSGAMVLPPVPDDLPPSAQEYLREREILWAKERENLLAEARRADQAAVALKRDFERRIFDSERQRDLLAQDVQTSQERVVALQEALDGWGDAAAATAAAEGVVENAAESVPADASGVGDVVNVEGDGGSEAAALAAAQAAAKAADAERDRILQQSRQLQQRLEQLVAVHRQLLRKFGQLELDSGDAKKKIALRDERIRQLESNATQLTARFRAQAEQFNAEIAKVRSEVVLLKEDREARRSNQHTNHHYGPPGSSFTSNSSFSQSRTIRGGGASHHISEVRTIRGGGGGNFYYESSSSGGGGGGGGSGSGAVNYRVVGDGSGPRKEVRSTPIDAGGSAAAGRRGSLLGRFFGAK